MKESFSQKGADSIQRQIQDIQSQLAKIDSDIERNLLQQNKYDKLLDRHRRDYEKSKDSMFQYSHKQSIDADNKILRGLNKDYNSLVRKKMQYLDELKRLNVNASSAFNNVTYCNNSIPAHNESSSTSYREKKISNKKALAIAAIICLIIFRLPLNETAESHDEVNNSNAGVIENITPSDNGSSVDTDTNSSNQVGETAQPSSKPHVHEYVQETIQVADCVNAGVVKYVCSCGDFYEEAVEAYGHTTEIGRCSRCGYNFVSPVELSGHGDFGLETDTVQLPHGVYEVVFTVDKDEESDNADSYIGWGMYINSGKVRGPEWTEADHAVMHGTVSTVWDFDSAKMNDELYPLTFTINLCCSYKLEIIPINE